MVSQSTSLCPVVLGYVLWCRLYGQNGLIQWCVLWCHNKLCDVSTWSVMPWCILWCQHDICDAMMYSVMLTCGLWCHDTFSDIRTCEMIMWCQDMFFDAVFHYVTVATGRGLAGKPRQTDPGMGRHQNRQFLPVQPVTHWCPPPWAEVSTAFTFFEIAAIFPHTTLPGLHPTIPSLSTMLLLPSICWTKITEKKKKKNITNMVLLAPGCWTSTQTSVWI